MNLPIPSLAGQEKAGNSFPAPLAAPHAHLRTTVGDVAETGLTVVYEPENSEPILDIVFIHGLQGHPFKTWATPARAQKRKAPDDGRTTAKLRRLFSGRRSSKTAKDVPGDESARRPVFWPADLLPPECPQARILVFGYQTTVAKHHFAGPVNKKSIFVHSRELVNDLSRARPLTRPLLFVGHSLGGLVIKEALGICSSSNVQQYGAILQSTAGIVFLGTPHRGSPAASIGEIARKAARALLMDTNSRILDSISLKNSDLERCQEVFSSLWMRHNFSVKTFQESLPLKLPFRVGQPTMGKVVPDTSSCLGDPRERTESLDGDHREMCRYATALDPNFIKVAAEVRTVHSAVLSDAQASDTLETGPIDTLLTRLQLTCQDQEKLEYFKFDGMLLRQFAISAPADNTCLWLPDTPSFKAWTNRIEVEKHHGFLQIIGRPGSGKSTLMRSIFEATRSSARKRNDGTCVVSHFFNSSGKTLERCTMGMFHSLLYQLATLHPPCLGAFEEHGLPDLQWRTADLQWLRSSAPESYLVVLRTSLRRIFSDRSLSPRKTVIFIDALDECIEGDAAQTGYFFAKLTESAQKHDVELDVCISRREHPSVTVQDCLEIRMEAYNLQDIVQYIFQKLGLVGMSPQVARALHDAIVQKSNGIFLWVVLAVEGILKGFESGHNAKHMLERAKSLPNELEQLFSQLLNELNPDELQIALRVFQWAVLPTSRLRIREWHHILAFIREKPPLSLKEWKESDYYTETDAQLERRIRDITRGLVEVKGGGDVFESAASEAGSLRAGAGSLDSTAGDSRVVQPIHETLVEFLTSGRANARFGKGPDYSFTGDGHLAIATACLDYIGIAEFDDLAAARKRQQGQPSGSPVPPIEYRGLRRRDSNASFMSSASSHSARYRHNEAEEIKHSTDNSVPLAEHMDVISPSEEPSTSPPIKDDDLLWHSKNVVSPPGPETPSSPGLWKMMYGDDFVSERDGSQPEPETNLPQDGPFSGIVDCETHSASAKSQTLEEYPALASYALNRVFVHAKAGHDLGADPIKLLDRLVRQDCWSRWCCLQEHATEPQTLQDLLYQQGLDRWVESLKPTSMAPAFTVGFPMEVYELAGFMDGTTELFRSAAPGRYLQLTYDPQSGVFTTPSDSPVSVSIDARNIARIERATLGETVCVVMLVYSRDLEAGGEAGEREGERGGEARTQTLVLEKPYRSRNNALSDAYGFYRRVHEWNDDAVFRASGDYSGSIWWRFDSSSVTTETAATPPVQL